MSKEILQHALDSLEAIVQSDWRTWQELSSPEEFERWVKSRANKIAIDLREAIAQPDVPEAAFGKMNKEAITEPEQPDDLTIAYLTGYHAGKRAYREKSRKSRNT